MNDRHLKKLFQFTDADLSANRQGCLSDNQKRRLAERMRATRKSAHESAVILFAAALVGLIFGLIFAFTAPTPGSRLFFVLILCTLWPVTWGGRAIQILRALRSLKEEQLQSTRGRVHLITHNDSAGAVEHILQVNDFQFDIDGHPSDILLEGQECVVYYLKESEVLLSVETR